MLYEIKNIKKYDDGIPIRWFCDDYFDLVLWFDDYKSITAFQLTYDRYYNPYALTWKDVGGFFHDKVDDGEIPGRNKKKSILVPDGQFSKNEIAAKFKSESVKIDSKIRKFIYHKILLYDK